MQTPIRPYDALEVVRHLMGARCLYNLAAVDRPVRRVVVWHLVRLRTVAVPFAVAALAIVLGAVAASALVQGGRHTNNSTANAGTSVSIAGVSFSPGSGHCIAYSTLAFSAVNNKQVESGVVRCNGTSVDGSCDDVKFVETGSNGAFSCYPHGSFTNSFFHTFKVMRQTGDSPYFFAYIDGTLEEGQGGFSTSNPVELWSWGERTGSGTGCTGWGGSGAFQDWQKLVYGNPWTDISGAISTTCWTVSGIDINKEWHVDN